MTDELEPTPAGITGSDPATTGARSGQARAGASRSAYTVAAAAPPVLTTIAPTSSTVGAATLTLTATGSNFDTAATLIFGGATLNTTRVSATQLTAPVTPPATGSGSTVQVIVRNGSGVTSSAKPFTYAAPAPPVLTTIAPSSATVGGLALTLTATGSNFDTGAVLLWNGDPLPTTRVSSTSLTAPVTPPATGTGGAVSVVVRNGTLALSAAQTFTVLAPTPPVLTAIAPTSATLGDAVFSLTATGSNFDTGAVIVANGLELPTTRISPTQLTTPINLAGATAGTVPVLVRNATGAVSASQSFVVNPAPVPVLASIFPTARNVGDVFILTAYGSTFSVGAVILWNGNAVPTTRVSSGELSTPMDLGGAVAGTVSVVVRNPVGTESAPQPFVIHEAIIPGQRLPVIVIGGVPTGPAASRRVLVASLSIHDQLNEVPNTCTLTVQGQRPAEGAELVIAYGSASNPTRLFAGTIVRATQLYVAQRPENVLWQLEGIDYGWSLNRRFIVARYTNQSATAIALDLVAKWAPAGFTTDIEADLPVLDEISFTNTPLLDAFAQLATRIGGYAECDYFKTIKLWINPTGTPPTPLTPSHPSLQEFQVTRDLSQVVTRALVEGGGANALALVVPGETRIPVEDATWYAGAGGRVVSGPQRLTYTGRVEAGGGAMASAVGGGTGHTAPLAPPTVGTAAGAGLPAGTYRYAYTWTTSAGESLPSPAAPFNTAALGGPGAAPGATPVDGTGLGSGAYRYAFTWVTAGGETVPSPVATANTTSTTVAPPQYWVNCAKQNGAGLDAGTYYYSQTFVTASGETTNTTSSPSVTISASEVGVKAQVFISNIQAGPAGVIARKLYRRNYFAGGGDRLLVTINNNTTLTYVDTAPDSAIATNPNPPATNTTTKATQQVALSGIATGPSGVTSRKIYRSTVNGSSLFLTATLANNSATSYTDALADGSLGVAPPSSSTAVLAQAVLSAIAVGPTLTANRKIYRTVKNGTALKLLGTITNNTSTTFPADTLPDASLGTAAPTTDTSGLPSQIEGGQVPAGSATIPVASVDPFKPEGWCSVGHQLVRYRGVSATELTGIPPDGPGSLEVSIPYNTPITVVPQVTGIPATGAGAIVFQILPGDPVNLLVILDDHDAQVALASVLGGDGVVEDYQQDRRINLAEAQARAAALLDLKAAILETYRYRSRDPLTKSGTTITVDLAAPTDVHGTYEIQDVTISGFLGTDEYPFYDVTASSRRFTFEDLLRRRRAATTSG